MDQQVDQPKLYQREKTDFERLQPSTRNHLIQWFTDYSQEAAVEDLLHMIPTTGLHQILRDIWDQLDPEEQAKLGKTTPEAEAY